MRVHIDGVVWHLDVVSSQPKAASGFKGLAVRQVKWYVRWVQNVVKQFGPYLPYVLITKIVMYFSTKGFGPFSQWCIVYLFQK